MDWTKTATRRGGKHSRLGIWCALNERFDSTYFLLKLTKRHTNILLFSTGLGTSDGNSNGADCVFPFTYGGLSFDQCVDLDRGGDRRWCSTTADYDADGKWGYCGKCTGQSRFSVTGRDCQSCKLVHRLKGNCGFYIYFTWQRNRYLSETYEIVQLLYRPSPFSMVTDDKTMANAS